MLFLGALVLELGGCYSAYDYVGPPDGALKYGSGFKPVNAATYQVDPVDFPIYRVTSVRLPPRSAFMKDGVLRKFDEPTSAILPTDKWEVRYKFRDFLMVNSLEFDKRVCQELAEQDAALGQRHSRLKADGTCNYGWCIYISAGGSVTGGWDTCTIGKDKIIFKPDPDAVKLQDWGPQPFFEVIPRTMR